MDHFMRGFAAELVKLAAFPQHESSDSYDSGSSIIATMDRTQGASAKTNLKIPGQATPSAPRAKAPTPMTSPNHMVDYSGNK